MTDEKDALPSDAESGGLKPEKPSDKEPPAPPPVEKEAEQDPSEQPS